MNSIAMRAMAIAVGSLMVTYPQKSEADGFTGTEFLGWSESQQKGYLEAQLVMASTIATRTDAPRSDCIAATFFDERGLSPNGYQSALHRIGEFEEFHPSSVLVIMIENACGAY